MSKVTPQIKDIDSALTLEQSVFTYLPKIAAPSTTVVNRAQVTNFAADGLPKYGIDRKTIQSIIEVQGEQGPNGERVFKALNDFDDAVRFYGSWTSTNSVNGSYANDTAGNGVSYWEFTFYGTGANILISNTSATTATLAVAVDGGAESNAFSSTYSAVLASRNYNQNMVLSIASGLSLGMHTIKGRYTSANTPPICGFEALNTSASIFLPTAQSYAGGRRLYSATTGTTTYNSSFESGTLGTRGGHVLVYQKADGTIAKAVQPTDASALYLTSASHTNEEIVRTFHWREFGAGRTDDFSYQFTASSNRAFTLDDGTTTLVGNSVDSNTINSTDCLRIPANDGTRFVTLTFVGTGLDMIVADSSAGAYVITITVDGSAAGTLTTAATAFRTVKVVSGLPYGTHTVKILGTSGTPVIHFNQFIVYAPKTPTPPTGAVALSDYFIMADFTANTTATATAIATGILRKTQVREWIYVDGTGGTNSWAVSLDTAGPAGFQPSTDRQNAYFEYTFFGTGFEQRFQIASNRSANVQVSLQSISTGGSLQNLTTTNFPSISGNTSVYGTGAVFTASTGILDMQDASASYGGVRVSGLPLALYKVRFLNNTASAYMTPDAIDIITPVYAPKELSPARIQNVSLIGSSAVRDLRVIAPTQLPVNYNKAWNKSSGITASPNIGSTTNDLPVTDLSATIKTSGGPIQISYSISALNSTTGLTYFAIYLNGAIVSTYHNCSAQTPATQTVADSIIIPVTAGVYKIDLYCQISAGVSTAVSTYRDLIVREL